MEDRKASVLAAAVGCAAIGGLWLARPKVVKASLKVVEQIVLPHGGKGDSHDAVALFRVELPSVVREAMEDGQAVVLRVADRNGNAYPLVPVGDYGYEGSLKLVRGYASNPESPRIEAVTSAAVLASASIADLPAPVRNALEVRPDHRIGAIYRGYGWLEAKNLVPLAKDERWHIEALRTRYAVLEETAADLPIVSPRWPTQRLLVPYPEQTDALELHVMRLRLVEHSVVVRIPGLRVGPMRGGTGVFVDRDFDVPTSLGFTLHVPKQWTGPRRPVRHGDPRVAGVNALLVFKDPPLTEEERRARARQGYAMSVEILSPAPESLGLRELRVGPAIRSTSILPKGLLRERTFTAVLRVTSTVPERFDEFSATVPVTQGAPSADIPIETMATPPRTHEVGIGPRDGPP